MELDITTLVQLGVYVAAVVVAAIVGKEKVAKFFAHPTFDMVMSIAQAVFDGVEKYKEEETAKLKTKPGNSSIKAFRRNLIVDEIKRSGNRATRKAVNEVTEKAERKFKKAKRAAKRAAKELKKDVAKEAVSAVRDILGK